MDLYEQLRFDERLTRLVELIETVNRPGGFCTHGRLFAPMPRIVVAGAPVLSFPIPDDQANALVGAAERAPYGRGQETLYDASVRNCWQLDPRRIRIEGGAWPQTLAQILREAAAGLGFPPAVISGQLYKMLVYESGGFFAPHRDTEKADRMVATLVVSLPTAGNGGDLVVRHHGREQVVEMQTDEPSELVHAAFYADCEHEIRPVTDGYRVALVYNLIRRKQARVAASAPDHRDAVAPLAAELGKRFREMDAGGKLVWVLEHDYSEAGLSFDTLKNVDQAVADVVTAAAGEADCGVFAAILHAEQTDAVMVYDDVYDDDDPNEDDFEVVETDDFGCWLDGWMSPDGGSPGYGSLGLRPGELMPFGRLDLDRPDSQRLTEATGNGGATVERLYRSAALVIWPRRATLQVIAPGGAETILRFLAAEQERESAGSPVCVGVRELANQVAEVWPTPFRGSLPDEKWARHTVKAMDALRSIANPAAALGFLERVVLPHYQSVLNEALAATAAQLGAARMRGFLPDLVRRQAPLQPRAILELLHSLIARLDQGGPDPEWAEALRETMCALCAAAAAFGKGAEADAASEFRFGVRRQPVTLSAGDLGSFYGLVWRFDLEDEAADATESFIGRGALVSPDRVVPELVEALRTEWPARAAESQAFAALWRHGAGFLLSRSGTPPAPPADWKLPTANLRCRCRHCADLRGFCAHPERTQYRVRAVQQTRGHLTDRIDGSGLDLGHQTEKRGRPYTLVVSKTRASHERRLREYEADVAAMRQLLSGADAVADSGPRTAELTAAVARAG